LKQPKEFNPSAVLQFAPKFLIGLPLPKRLAAQALQVYLMVGNDSNGNRYVHGQSCSENAIIIFSCSRDINCV